MSKKAPGPRTRAAQRALASHLYAMLRSPDSAHETATLERLRLLLARRRRRKVTEGEAHMFFVRAWRQWKADASARSRSARARRKDEGKCTRCKTRPARPGGTTCETCNETAKAAVRDERAAKAGGNPQP